MARGSEEATARVFDALDANLPAGWRRLSEDELPPSSTAVAPDAGWYGFKSTSGHGEVVLCIDRLWKSELRGGWVRFPGPLHLTNSKPVVPLAWQEVGRFLDEAIVPAARMVGLSIEAPTAPAIFLEDLPFDVRDRLQMFSDHARKSLPLDRKGAELWHRFVIAAYREKVIVSDEPLIQWLMDGGWPLDAATGLSLLLIDHCILLASYQDEVSAA